MIQANCDICGGVKLIDSMEDLGDWSVLEVGVGFPEGTRPPGWPAPAGGPTYRWHVVRRFLVCPEHDAVVLAENIAEHFDRATS